MKNILMAAPLALAVAFFAIPAQAGAPADIAVGEPYPGGYDPGYHPYPTPDYDDEDEDSRGQISCWEGKRIVRERHFYRVHPMRCEGAIYRYQAFKNGHPWVVKVNSYSARIVSARPLRVY
jgi:hypothetical protein